MEQAKTILKSEYILQYKTMLLKFCQNHNCGGKSYEKIEVVVLHRVHVFEMLEWNVHLQPIMLLFWAVLMLGKLLWKW